MRGLEEEKVDHSPVIIVWRWCAYCGFPFAVEGQYISKIFVIDVFVVVVKEWTNDMLVTVVRYIIIFDTNCVRKGP